MTVICFLGVLFPIAHLLGCDEGSGGPTDLIAPGLALEIGFALDPEEMSHTKIAHPFGGP